MCYVMPARRQFTAELNLKWMTGEIMDKTVHKRGSGSRAVEEKRNG
jgi:hypothetical protein